MTKQGIRRKFDEIVAFAEVERFIDTPVKRYSSGMYVRLAFAVAAHLEPEVLVVDEVLAVGDAAFQKKCLGKMEGIANQGRTIFFVSHNMGAVLSLCSKALLLESGSIQSIGQPRDVVQKYMETAQTFGIVPLDQRDDRAGDGTARVTSIQIESTAPDKIVRSTSSLKVTLSYKSAMPLVNAKFLVGIYDYRNTGIFLLNSEETGSLPAVLPPEGSLTCTTGPINLTPGSCFANVAIIKAGDMADHVQYAAQIHVEEGDFHGTGKVPARERALCVLKYEWSVLS
jgi:lipopolysaccharide transport system ATP-binding protein